MPRCSALGPMSPITTRSITRTRKGSFMLYAITAVCNRTEGQYQRTIQMPTFYLDSNVQGIRDAGHAQRIAENMFASTNPEATFTVAAVARWEECPWSDVTVRRG